MNDLEALAARVEAADGRDMKLGHELLVAVGRRHPDAVEGFGYPDSHADPTASIDAALQLVPPKHHWQVGVGIETEFGRRDRAYAWCAKGDTGELHIAATPALALCAAALRARASQ